MPVFNDSQLKELAATPLSELSPKVDKAFPAQSEEFLKLRAVPISERVYYEAEPLWKWVLIRKLEREVNAFGGDVVGKVDTTRSQTGIILAISDLCVQKKLKVDDRVLFTNYPMMLPDLLEATGEKDVMLIREEEIYCVLKPKPRPQREEVADPEPANVEAT
jgi:co-chaperonin GroES (HSP10)